MRARFFTTLSFLALLCLCGAYAQGVDSADREAQNAIQRLAGETPVKPLSRAEYRLGLWVMGRDRQWNLKPVEASLLLQAGAAVYAREAGTGRFLIGSLHPKQPDRIEFFNTFKNLPELVKSSTYPELPKPPKGFTVREVVRLPEMPVRLASDGRGETLYVLCLNGDVWELQVASGALRSIVRGSDYLEASEGRRERNVLGILHDAKKRLYLVANERVDAQPMRNEVTIFRTGDPDGDGKFDRPRPWLKTSYPWGIGAYNHGVNHIATGPDGKLYVSSGSRTDGNETGSDSRYSRAGEVPLTACIWRLDPEQSSPRIEIYARGLRNAYGFCWDDEGRMFATDNGPNADAPEELNLIREGRHYGFPFKFADWERKPYRYTPDPPPGQAFEKPIANLGPAGGGSSGRPLYTFTPHSSAGGIVWLGADFPPPYRSSLLVARFGSMMDNVLRAGFDVLHVDLEKEGKDPRRARMHEFMNKVARPIDLHLAGRGKIYLLEYSRQTSNHGFGADLPGRVLEITAGASRP